MSTGRKRGNLYTLALLLSSSVAFAQSAFAQFSTEDRVFGKGILITTSHWPCEEVVVRLYNREYKPDSTCRIHPIIRPDSPDYMELSIIHGEDTVQTTVYAEMPPAHFTIFNRTDYMALAPNWIEKILREETKPALAFSGIGHWESSMYTLERYNVRIERNGFSLLDVTLGEGEENQWDTFEAKPGDILIIHSGVYHWTNYPDRKFQSTNNIVLSVADFESE